MSISNRIRALLVSVALLVTPLVLVGQDTGLITGTVTDSSGAIIPNASINITNKATGAARAATTNAEGLYSAPSLQAGDYSVRAEKEGFRALVREAIVQAGSPTTVNLSMTVGSAGEVVTVEAASAAVNYESHTIAGLIARETIQDIPLNGRSSLQLASLEPGVTVSAGATSQFNAMFNVSVFGATAGATAGSGVGAAITMDGGTINDEVEGGTSMNFSQEVVQEFQISSANFDASTGIAASGAINIVTRSGSNDFHGSGYFYFRDHNAAAYPGLKRSPLNPNPFFARRNPGFWLGGPAIKDKLFFFGSYEHLNQTSVITSAYDLPSLTPITGVYASPLSYNWITTRFDYRLSDKNTFFARFSHDGNKSFGPYTGTGAPSAWVYNSNWSDQSIIGLTTIFGSNLVNDFRAQYHYWQNSGPNAKAADCVAPCIGIGLPSIISMVGTTTYTYGAGNDPNGPQYHQSRSYQAKDNVSWQKGAHRIRFGIDYERMKTGFTPWDVCDPACISVYSVEQAAVQTASFPTGSVPLPSAIRTTADLLSLPISAGPAALYSGVGLGNGSFPGVYQHDQGAVNQRIHPYLADTWKASQNLTLNFGIGYEYETGLFSSFLARPQYLAPILNGQTGGVPSGLGATPARSRDFSPQFGFAYALGKEKKTVIRGGAGLYWDTSPIWEQFRQDSSIGPLGDGRITLAASAFTNIFPGKYTLGSNGQPQPLAIGAPLILNVASNVTLGEFIQIMNTQSPIYTAKFFGNTPTSGPYSVSGIQVTKQGVEIYPADFPLLHSYQTSLGFQRDLGHDMVLTVDWARRQGVHVSLGEQDLNRYTRLSGPVIPKCTTAPDFDPTHNCSLGGITVWVPEGRSVYDGLLVKLQKRFSHGYQFTASYAFQKLLGESAAVNLDNFMAGYGPTLSRQNLNVAGVVNLPFGVRLSVNSSVIAPSPINPIVTGIDLNGSGQTSYSLAQAVPGISYNCFNYSCGKDDLAKAVASFNANVATASTGKKALNGATIPTLTLPTNYDLGTWIFSQDVRLTKEFSYKERYKLQLFGEAFNLFNVANLTYSGTPSLNVPASFGQPTGRVGQASTFGSGGPRAIQFGGRISF
jgi:hypothetical protein